MSLIQQKPKTSSQKYIITTLFFCVILIQAYSQKKISNQSPINIMSFILDTIEIKTNSTLVSMRQLNDTIKVGIQNEEIKIDTSQLATLRKLYKDSTLWRTQKELDDLIRIQKTGAQNCYSYALEKFFSYNKIFNQNIFQKTTRIDEESLKKILDNYFIIVDEFSLKQKINLKKNIPNDVIIAFVNNSAYTLHLIYYCDGIFYSKNGINNPVEFKSLIKFSKHHYLDSKKIIVYKIDLKKSAIATGLDYNNID